MNAMTNVVYRLVSKDGRFYVGSTGNIEQRLARHFSELKAGKHHNVTLQSIWDVDPDLEVTFLFCKDREEAYEIEGVILREYEDSGLLINIGRHARGGDNFTLHPNQSEIRIKYVLAMAGLTEEERIKRFSRPGELNGMYGKSHSNETRNLLSAKLTGNKHRLGRIASAETKHKLSEIARGRTGNANSFFGKQHSEESKKRIAASKIGKKPTNTNRIEIDGITYQSQADAAKALGVAVGTITYRLKSNNKRFSGYRVIDEVSVA